MSPRPRLRRRRVLFGHVSIILFAKRKDEGHVSKKENKREIFVFFTVTVLRKDAWRTQQFGERYFEVLLDNLYKTRLQLNSFFQIVTVK